MKPAIFVILAIALVFADGNDACGWQDSPAGEERYPELAGLKLKLEVALEMASSSTKTLDQQYQGQLDALKEKFMAEGNLEQLLLVEKERAAPGTVTPNHGGLQRIQGIYLTERKRRNSELVAKELEIYEVHAKAARGLRKSLTKQGKIEGAKLADHEAKRLEALIEKSTGKPEAAGREDKVDSEALLAEMTKKWHPAIWIHPQWLDEKWDRMEREATSEGVVVTNTSGVYTNAKIVHDEVFKRSSNFEINVTMSGGPEGGIGIIKTNSNDGGVGIARSNVEKPTVFTVRCMNKQITFLIDGEAVEPDVQYEMDHRTVEEFRVSLPIKDKAELTIHDFSFQRLKKGER